MPDVTIKYGSSTIAELSDSGTKICKTENTIVQDDIEIEYTKPGSGGTVRKTYIDTTTPIKMICEQYELPTITCAETQLHAGVVNLYNNPMTW